MKAARLYFMEREFEGHCLDLYEAIEGRTVRLLFGDSWYWLHYEFFSCRDVIASEQSSVLRTHLYNLAAMLYRGFEDLPDKFSINDGVTLQMIAELVEIAEYSESFPISLWIYGDGTSRQELSEAMARLPSNDQLEYLMSLRHFQRRERERLSYAHDGPVVAHKRYKNELAAFNKRAKLSAKNEQRKRQQAEQTPAKRD